MPVLAGFTAAAEQTRYRRNPAGETVIEGAILNTNAYTAPSGTIFVLDPGFRPDRTVTFAIGTNAPGYAAILQVTSGGLVTIQLAGGAPNSAGLIWALDGVRFPAWA